MSFPLLLAAQSSLLLQRQAILQRTVADRIRYGVVILPALRWNRPITSTASAYVGDSAYVSFFTAVLPLSTMLSIVAWGINTVTSFGCSGSAGSPAAVGFYLRDERHWPGDQHLHPIQAAKKCSPDILKRIYTRR
ncbi:hypothetical protein DENSPDRAFT_881860 [Dentipellis sp. KUC8613]|nr:hypothetical protein DENSPDRAFT_881860 [Dentipellis sp. KUC8613]